MHVSFPAITEVLFSSENLLLIYLYSDYLDMGLPASQNYEHQQGKNQV